MKSNFFYTLLVILFFVTLGIFLWSFSKENSLKNDILNKSEKISILNFGDVMFDRGVRNIMEKYDRDPFQYIKKDLSFTKKYDVIIANLEGPIVEMDRAKCQQKIYNFQFSSSTPRLLQSIGINMVNIANNHSYDCYSTGLSSTKNYLQKAGIEFIGSSDIEKSFVIKTINNKKMAFVGMDQTVSPILISNFYPIIKKLKLENDYVIVHIHWGTEYELKETLIQKTIAHSLIDNGADIVIGHHSHVIEPLEIYKNKVIIYSLGNFVFDQSGVNETSGIGAGVDFYGSTTEITIMPYKIKSFAPDFLIGDDKKIFCDNYLKIFNHEGCVLKLF